MGLNATTVFKTYAVLFELAVRSCLFYWTFYYCCIICELAGFCLCVSVVWCEFSAIAVYILHLKPTLLDLLWTDLFITAFVGIIGCQVNRIPGGCRLEGILLPLLVQKFW